MPADRNRLAAARLVNERDLPGAMTPPSRVAKFKDLDSPEKVEVTVMLRNGYRQVKDMWPSIQGLGLKMHRGYRAARSATSLNAVMATGEMVLHCKNAHVPYDLFVVARIEFLEWTRTVDY